MEIISVNNLTKNFGKVVALSNINFSVEEGEIFGLVGPDGAGKSTLFNILTTLILPTEGSATLLNMNLYEDYKTIRKNIGYLPGTFSLYADLTVEENLRFFATMYRSKIQENMRIISPIWKQLVPFKKRQAGKLSGGMKQKLALCCALIHSPKILFLDEPTTGVDPVSRREFWDLLKNIQKNNVTVIVSTPYMDEATRCDRIALIQNGEIITIDQPQNIVDNYKGKLYSLKSSSVFKLMELMKEFPQKCSFYPYGEYLHISFYNDYEVVLQEFENFLLQHNHNYSDLIEIKPTIEDCFIELIKEYSNV